MSEDEKPRVEVEVGPFRPEEGVHSHLTQEEVDKLDKVARLRAEDQKLFDEKGNWIGAEFTQEMSIEKAKAIWGPPVEDLDVPQGGIVNFVKRQLLRLIGRNLFQFQCTCGQGLMANVPNASNSIVTIGCNNCSAIYRMTWHGDHFSFKVDFPHEEESQTSRAS